MRVSTPDCLSQAPLPERQPASSSDSRSQPPYSPGANPLPRPSRHLRSSPGSTRFLLCVFPEFPRLRTTRLPVWFRDTNACRFLLAPACSAPHAQTATAGVPEAECLQLALGTVLQGPELPDGNNKGGWSVVIRSRPSVE